MRIRYSTWSMAAILLIASAALGHAAAGNTASSSKPAASTAKKPVATAPHSAVRRHAPVRHAALVHAQIAPAPSRISEIQAALAKDGTYHGTPNGQWDATAIDAMRQFQNEHNLNPSGKIDALTLQKLGLGSQVAGMGAPLPLAVPQAAAAADSKAETERP